MMKHFFIVLSLNLLLSTAAMSQVQIGLKAGPMLANIATEGVGMSSSTSSEAKISYMAGGFATLSLNEKMNLQVELLYANKGNRLDVTDSKLNLHYITLPILLQYKIIDRLKAELGPEASYLIGAYSRNPSLRTSRELDNLKNFDIGVDVGVSYDLTEKLMLGLRYNLGVYDTSEDIVGEDIDRNPIVIKSKPYNRTLQLSVGYKL